MSTNEVCRICLAENNLVWVFDNRFAKTDHMKDVIFVTTGVEIHMKDVISQKICIKCAYDAIKMFRFREKALKNDKYLKEECRKLLKDKRIKIPHTDVTIKTEKTDPTKDDDKNDRAKRQPYKVHPSLYALSKKYPKTQFPSICVKSHVAPIVSMEMDAVENYFKARNLKMEDYVRLALRQDQTQEDHRVPPINIVKDRSTGYSIRISIDDDEDDQEDVPKAFNKLKKKRRRRLSDDDLPDVEESKPIVFACPNCSDVLDTAEDLSTHETRHLRCQFCKNHFPTVADKEKHEETACHHKKALEKLPDVEVCRIDNDPTLRQSYPQAFVDLAPAANSVPMEIIEILSDDEDDKRSSVSVLRPDVRISDSNLLDKVKKQTSDILLIKEFLLRFKIGPDTSDKELQTELPHNKSIKVDEKALTVELTGLKPLISLYKIPVYVTNFGPLKAQYNYEPVKVQPKKFYYWNDLKPIDVESKSSRVVKSSTPCAADFKTGDSVNSDPVSEPVDRVENVKLKHERDSCETGTKSTTEVKPTSCDEPGKRGKKRASTETKSVTSKKKPLVESISSDDNISSTEMNASKLLKSLCGKPSDMVESNHDSTKIRDIDLNNLLSSSGSANLGFSFNNGRTTITPVNRIDTPSNETSTSPQSHSNVSIPRTSPSNPAVMTPVVLSNILIPGTGSITSVQPLPNIDNNDRRRLPAQVHSNVPRNVPPPRTPYGNQPRIHSSSHNNPPMQNQLHSNVLIPLLSVPNVLSRTSPNDQPSGSSLIHLNVPPRTSPINHHPKPNHSHDQPPLSQLHSKEHPRTSADNQLFMTPQLHSHILLNQPSTTNVFSRTSRLPSQLTSNILPRISPNNPTPVPSLLHSNTFPRTSPNSQAAVPSQLYSNALPRTSPNTQAAVPSQLYSDALPRSCPSNIPPLLSQQSNNLPRSCPSNIPPLLSQQSNNLPRSCSSNIPPLLSQLPSMTFRVPRTYSNVPSNAGTGPMETGQGSHSTATSVTMTNSHCFNTAVSRGSMSQYYNNPQQMMQQLYGKTWYPPGQDYSLSSSTSTYQGVYESNQQVSVANNGRPGPTATVGPQGNNGQNVLRLPPPTYDEAAFNSRQRDCVSNAKQSVNSIRVRNLCELR